VFVAPLERELTFPFVPHVTLADDMEPERIAASIAALAGFVVEVEFTRVHLLQEQRHGDAHRRWVPIADAPFARPAIVGRGGIELELGLSRLVDPQVAAFERDAWGEEIPPVAPATGGGRIAGRMPLVVVARRRGEVVGLARGWTDDERATLEAVVVDPSHRRQGVGRHLLAAFDHAAAQHDHRR
jgi:ribosomal protein S18 acetylase RimI-like enzyme